MYVYSIVRHVSSACQSNEIYSTDDRNSRFSTFFVLERTIQSDYVCVCCKTTETKGDHFLRGRRFQKLILV